jgi:arylsulfatase A-like enzyme
MQPAELLDIYPTLIELTGVPKRERHRRSQPCPAAQGRRTKRERPAITSHNQGNHGIRSENWRYIHYADGSEELYDMVNDPTNGPTSLEARKRRHHRRAQKVAAEDRRATRAEQRQPRAHL